MSNLTFDHRLLKEHTPEPLEGHSVVVFERVGDRGDEFHSILLPGAAPVKPGLALPFRKRTEYFAYAVDTSPDRQLDFSESMRLADQMFEFRVVFNLSFGVSDVRALARARNLDPLKRVREQVRGVVKREVEMLPRHAMGEAFPRHARMIVDDCMGELREGAASYGIELRSLRLALRLPEAIEGVLQGEHLDIARQSSVQRVTNHGRTLELQNEDLAQAARLVDGNARLEMALIESTIAAADRADLSAMNELIKGTRTLHAGGGAAPGGAPRADGGDGTRPQPDALRSGAFNGERGLLSASTSGGNGLGGVLAHVMAATDSVRVRVQKQALRAALLHLVAEVLVDETGDGPATAGHAERARKAIERLSPSPVGAELDVLKALADPEHLLSRLDS